MESLTILTIHFYTDFKNRKSEEHPLVTIKDIAKIAGVSHTTVSRALNGNPIIKKTTRDRINQIAADLNYIPNYNAKSLVMKKSYTIGLFFSSIDQGTSASFLVDVIKGINAVVDENYNLSVNGIDSIKNLDSILPQRFDGIIVMSQSDQDNSFIYHVKQAGIPLVVLNRQLGDVSIANVLADDRSGVRFAIDFALEQGHRKIAIIEGKTGFKSSLERKEGFLESMSRAKVNIRSEYLVRGDYSIESGFKQMNRLLDLDHPPTLVFCSNDDMAIGAMKACYAKNIQIPNDISIIGFDDIMFAQYTTPTLTTIRRPIAKISQVGAEKLIELMGTSNIPVSQILLDTKLILRESVKTVSVK